MSKYSSDSDSSDEHSRRKEKSRRKARSHSSSSSDSSSRHHRKHKTTRSRRRSHSSDVSHKSSRRDRDRSHDKLKSRYSRRSRSSSRCRSRRKSRSRSPSKSHSRKKSLSRSPSKSYSKSHSRKSRSRSGSKSKGRSRKRLSSDSSSESQSKDRLHRGRRSDSSSRHGRSSSRGSPTSRPQSGVQPSTTPQATSEGALTERLQKAIWAAKTADQQLRNQGLIGVKREQSPTFMVMEAINRSNMLDEINADGFCPRQFTSNSKRDEYPVVVDLASQPSVPTPVQVKQDPKAIFHSSLLVDEPQRLERWVKKLFNIRQRAINGEPLITV